MKKNLDKKSKPDMVRFDSAESGEIIYMYGDPSKCFVIDTKLEASIFLHEKGHDPIIGRIVLVKEEFEGRWFRRTRGYTKYSIIADDDPIPKISDQQFSEVLLKRLKQVGKMSFGDHVIENMDLRSLRDHMTDSLIFSLRTNVMTEQMSERSKTITFKYPNSWWDFLKLKHAPSWFVKKWPVKWQKKSQTVTFEEIALYPKLPSIAPEQSGEVFFHGMFNYDYPEVENKKETIILSIL